MFPPWFASGCALWHISSTQCCWISVLVPAFNSQCFSLNHHSSLKGVQCSQRNKSRPGFTMETMKQSASLWWIPYNPRWWRMTLPWVQLTVGCWTHHSFHRKGTRTGRNFGIKLLERPGNSSWSYDLRKLLNRSTANLWWQRCLCSNQGRCARYSVHTHVPWSLLVGDPCSNTQNWASKSPATGRWSNWRWFMSKWISH